MPRICSCPLLARNATSAWMISAVDKPLPHYSASANSTNVALTTGGPQKWLPASPLILAIQSALPTLKSSRMPSSKDSSLVFKTIHRISSLTVLLPFIPPQKTKKKSNSLPLYFPEPIIRKSRFPAVGAKLQFLFYFFRSS